MNKVDDKFEKFLMDKAKDEKSKFYIPFSFDTRIEESLKEVDKISFNKSKRWYYRCSYNYEHTSCRCIFC